MSERSDDWGPWTAWDATKAEAPPPEVQQGDLVMADLYIRPDRKGTTSAPDIVRGLKFIVISGESFCLHPMVTKDQGQIHA